MSEDKHISLDESNIALGLKHEQETQQLQEMHAQEKGELQNKIETAILDRREAETLKVVKDQALITKSNVQTS